MKTTWWVLALFGLWLAASPQEYSSADGTADALVQARAAADQRKASIRELLSFLDDEQVFKKRPQQAAQAVSLLGELRAQDAVPILLEHLDFLPVKPWHGEGVRDFPCAVALARIGSAAVPRVVQLVAADENADWLGVQILLRVDGRAVTCARLQIAAERARDAGRKERLVKAADFARHFAPNDPEIKD